MSKENDKVTGYETESYIVEIYIPELDYNDDGNDVFVATTQTDELGVAQEIAACYEDKGLGARILCVKKKIKFLN